MQSMHGLHASEDRGEQQRFASPTLGRGASGRPGLPLLLLLLLRCLLSAELERPDSHGPGCAAGNDTLAELARPPGLLLRVGLRLRLRCRFACDSGCRYYA